MKRRPTALELAAADLVAAEQLGAGRSQLARGRELLDVLERVRRRPHGGVDGLVFFELDELPETEDDAGGVVAGDELGLAS